MQAQLEIEKGVENKDYVKKIRNNGDVYIIKKIDYATAKEIIINKHYSKKWNSSFGKINYGIYYKNELLGVAVYGNLMNPRSANKIIESGKVIELNRLWIDDKLGHNTETMMLGATFTLLKNNTDYEIVQSFADGRLGCGTIYKASNFRYYGYTESVFYENIETKETHHQAPLDNTKRPKKYLLLNIERMQGLLKPFKVKTYRYLYPLKKKLKIKLTEQTYPEYDKGYEYIEMGFPIGSFCRLYNMYDHIGFIYGKELVIKTLSELYTQDQINYELEKQKQNKSYMWFVDEYGNKQGLLIELEKLGERK